MRPAWLVLLLLPLAGCLSDGPGDGPVRAACRNEAPDVRGVPLPAAFLRHADGQALQWPAFAYEPVDLRHIQYADPLVMDMGNTPEDQVWADGDDRWAGDARQGWAALGPTVATSDAAVMLDGEDGLVAEAYYRLDGCEPLPLGIEWPWTFASESVGPSASAGAGVLVQTAGFYENGTMFYTNIQELHDSDWPRAGWYAWSDEGGADPLPVYVYAEEAGEQPPHWKGAGRNCAALVADPVACAAASGLDAETGAGYVPTIRGFNEALKGMATTDLNTVWMAPEDAYTRQGAEEHPLFGEPLVFVIKSIAVAHQPCPPALYDAEGSAGTGACFRS